MSFLGITSYCRNFIPNYSSLEAHLGALIHGKGLQSAHSVPWTSEAESAFTQLKLALQTAPTLGIPDPHKPFIQAVDERHGCMTSVLMQEHGGRQRLISQQNWTLWLQVCLVVFVLLQLQRKLSWPLEVLYATLVWLFYSSWAENFTSYSSLAQIHFCAPWYAKCHC